MSSIRRGKARSIAAALGTAIILCGPLVQPVQAQAQAQAPVQTFATDAMTTTTTTTAAVPSPLSQRQQAFIPIAALAAVGNMEHLAAALHRGLDAGLTVNEAKEVLVQVYAYAGFPRSLNALGEFMKVLEARAQRGVRNVQGAAPSRPIPQGDALLAAGTANQTRLSGQPVTGPLFEFAPAIDAYLKTHLFGDIFERDNLDWPSRELATVGMLAAMTGMQAQLRSHVGIGMNVGLTAPQLTELAQVLADRVSLEAAQRAREALTQHLAARPED